MGRRVVPPPPPPGVLEVVIAYVVTHVDMAKLAVVTEMRKMTPGDKDTVIAGVFVAAEAGEASSRTMAPTARGTPAKTSVTTMTSSRASNTALCQTRSVLRGTSSLP